MCTSKFLLFQSNEILMMQDYPIQEFSLAQSNSIDIKYTVSHHGFFTVLQSTIGLAVFWDGGTRVYIQLDAFHRVSIIIDLV